MATKYFFPLYHPAAALYDGSMREVLLSDFKKIPKVLKDKFSLKNLLVSGLHIKHDPGIVLRSYCF